VCFENPTILDMMFLPRMTNTPFLGLRGSGKHTSSRRFSSSSLSTVIMSGRYRGVALESFDPWDDRQFVSQLGTNPKRFLQHKRPLLESGSDGLIKYLGLLQRYRCNLWLEVSRSTHYHRGDVRLRDYEEVRTRLPRPVFKLRDC
jgi:hypothetical protein